jgi:hypothetical protein
MPDEDVPDAGASDAEPTPPGARFGDDAVDAAKDAGDSDPADPNDADETDEDAGGENPDGTPRKRKRRRKRKRKSVDAPVALAGAAETMAALRSGLFSHLDDREIGCRVDGCDQTWVWTAHEQIQAFGQAPPRRMCATHEASVEAIADQEVPCMNPGCDKTWTFPRATALAQMQRTGSAEPPRRACDDCNREEKDLGDREVACRIDVCNRSWTWSRDAQLKHRTWMRRHGDAPPPTRGKRGRRGRRRGSVNEPPPRLCDLCSQKLAKITPEAGPCKVHGCTRTASVDKEQQLRAWAGLHTEDLDATAPLPRRMCEVCRDFCRAHPDREVACGRPECDKSWTYKTGAQLQAMLAGRHDDPIRLCDECVRGGFAREAKGPGGSEIMPCVVPLCEGVWHYVAGTQFSHARIGDLPIDRMCDACRQERGIEPRDVASESESESDEASPVSPTSTSPDATVDSATADVDATPQ